MSYPMTQQTRSDSFFILTGGPGSGKTSLLGRLAQEGYATMPEAGRGIIQNHVAIAGPALPWTDPLLFAELMLSWEMRSHAEAASLRGPVFFDRGVPDVAGYLSLTSLPVPQHVEAAAARFRYNRTVFILPPWPEIFGQDDERKQDFDEAVRTHDAMVETYRRLGYALVTVPKVSVEERVRFVLERSPCPPRPSYAKGRP